MKKSISISSALFLFLCTSYTAQAQVPVNIVYPINGGTYPVVGGPINAGSQYIEVSFGVTCGGGGYTVKWGFDGNVLGSTKFYDQASVQQTYKLPTGTHTFFVKTKCGSDKVKFNVNG